MRNLLKKAKDFRKIKIPSGLNTGIFFAQFSKLASLLAEGDTQNPKSKGLLLHILLEYICEIQLDKSPPLLYPSPAQPHQGVQPHYD